MVIYPVVSDEEYQRCPPESPEDIKLRSLDAVCMAVFSEISLQQCLNTLANFSHSHKTGRTAPVTSPASPPMTGCHRPARFTNGSDVDHLFAKETISNEAAQLKV